MYECFIKISSSDIRPNYCNSNTFCTLCSWKTSIVSIYCILQLNKLLKERLSCWGLHGASAAQDKRDWVWKFGRTIQQMCEKQSVVKSSEIKTGPTGPAWHHAAIRQFLSDNTFLLFETYVCKQNALWVLIWVHIHIQMSHTQYNTVSNQTLMGFLGFFFTHQSCTTKIVGVYFTLDLF